MDAGLQKNGQRSGYYVVNDKCYYLKKADPDALITEVFASRLLRNLAKLIGENKECIAKTHIVKMENQELYLASEVLPGSRPLFKDAHLAFHLPGEERTSAVGDWQQVPKNRPSFLQKDKATDHQISSGRYSNFGAALALCLLIDEIDRHTGNMSAFPARPLALRTGDCIPVLHAGKVIGKLRAIRDIEVNNSTFSEEDCQFIADENFEIGNCSEFAAICVEKDENGREVKVFERLVKRGDTLVRHYDLTNSFGDFRLFSRKLDGKIYPPARVNFWRYHPSLCAAPAYHCKLPREITEGNDFFAALARYAMLDNNKLNSAVVNTLLTTLNTFNCKPEVIRQFALRIGAPVTSTHSATLMKTDIIKHVQNCMSEKQEFAKKLFFDHFCQLSPEEQMDLQKSIDQPLENKSVEEKQQQALLSKCLMLLKTEHPLFFASLHRLQTMQDYLPVIDGIDLQQSKERLKHWQKLVIADLGQTQLRADNKRLQKIEAIGNALKKLLEQPFLTNIEQRQDKTQAQAFLQSLRHFQKTCIEFNLGQQFIVASTVFVATLLGSLLKGCASLLACIFPMKENNVLADNSFTAVFTAVRENGFSAMFSAETAKFCFKEQHTLGRFLLFSQANRATQHLAEAMGSQEQLAKSLAHT